MRLNEKYNQIISDIEDFVISNEDNLSSNNLLTLVANKYGYSGADLRDFNAAFLFVTNMRPLEYIKRRRLMHAYKFLTNQEKPKLHEAYVIAGYDNQNSFGKKFKSEFDMTPKQAWKKKDMGKFEQPLFWNNLEGVDFHMNNNQKLAETTGTIFGFDMKTYDKFVEFQNFCATYGVRKEQGEAAYEIADKYDLELEAAFEYVSNTPYVTREMFIENGYECYYGELDEDETPITAEEFDPKTYYMETIDNKKMIYCCISCGLSHDEASVALDRLELARYNYNPLECSAAFLYACAHADSVVEHLDRATRYYLDNLDEDLDYERFDYFLYLLDCNVPVEVAFDNAIEHLTDRDLNEIYKEEKSYYNPIHEDSVEFILDEMAIKRGGCEKMRLKTSGFTASLVFSGHFFK